MLNSGRAFIAALLAGPFLLFCTWWIGRQFLGKKRELLELRKKPESEEEYKETRKQIHATHQTAMDYYDKTLLWASGGAFIVSFSAVQFLSRQPDGNFTAAPGSSPFLLLGWGLLVFSVIIEIGAPYATTRMAVYSKTSLIAMYEEDDLDKAVVEKKKSEAWGLLTKYLNEGAYCSLLLAFWYLAVYVYANLPG